MKVQVLRNYDFPNFYHQSPNNEGVWEGIKFTTNPLEECDFLIALNPPNKDVDINIPQGNKWLFLQEPPVKSYEWHQKSFKDFDKVFGFWQSPSSTPSAGRTSLFQGDWSKITAQQTALPWHIQKSYDELIGLKPMAKKQTVSWITSNQTSRKGQQVRMQFLNYLQEVGFDFKLYGRGFQPIDDKYEGIAPHQYSIAIENYFCSNYWTEKIADCFLSWTMPIYAGATNITDYFPKESMILIDPSQPKVALEIIQAAIATDKFTRNQDAIEHARNLVLNKYQFFPWMAQKIRKATENPIGNAIPQFIPANLPPKRSFLEKAKNLFPW